jgi:AraC-like DNA-binding protein
MTPSALKLAPRYGAPLFNQPPVARPSGMQPIVRPVPPPIPRTTPERMIVARDRIKNAAETGQRIRSYEVALDLDLSEFHFARQFRAAFGKSPHVFYDEIRADRARELLREGLGEGEVARKIGFRRPAELRALLVKRTGDTIPPPAPSCDEAVSG